MYSVITGGCNTDHPHSFQMIRPNGLPHYVLLIIKTFSEFTLDGIVYHIAPGSAIIIDKNTPYSYYNPKGKYIDDWIHIKPTDDICFRQSGITFNEFFPLPNMNRFTLYLQQIFYENTYTPEIYQQENVDALVQTLINNLILAYAQKNNFSKYSVYNEKLKEMRLILQQEPFKRKTIQNMADELGISTSHFQHLYTKLFGISFQKDFIHMRVDYAANMLLTTDMPVNQVAELCGYSSTVHFHRQFRNITGLTPDIYRKKSHFFYNS